MRILISRLSALGDVTCSLPVAVALKKSFPDAEIVWVADKRFAGIPRLCPSIDQVVTLASGVAGTRAMLKELGEFDFGLDLQGLAKSALILALAKCKRRLGYHWQREGSWLVSQRVLPDKSSIHVVDQYVDVARAVGATADRAEFNLIPDPEDVTKMRDLLAATGWETSSPLVLMNAGAGWATKRWNPQHFAAVAKEASAHGATVAFLGTEADRVAFDEVCSHPCGSVIDMLGKSNVKELVALISLCRVHVAGDTGSTHIAAALAKKAVGTYTMTRVERSCPYGQMENCETDPDKVTRMVLEAISGGTA